jgi:hypothetical protein
MSNWITTPRARASYVAVFEKRFNKLSKKEAYSIVMLFAPGTDLTQLQKAVEAKAQEAYGPNWRNRVKRLPIRKMEEKAVKDPTGKLVFPDGLMPGGHFITANSERVKPSVVDERMNQIDDPSQFYSGCYCRVSLRAFAYDYGVPGVSFGLGNVQRWGFGESLTGRAAPEATFDEIPDVENGGVFDSEEV